MYRETNIISLLQKIRESVQEEVEAAPQTMTPQEDAEVETPDDMEDIEKEDLNKLDVSKKKDRKDAMKDVSDKELEIKPQERKKVKNGQLYLCNECCKIFESEEPVCSFCKSEKVEKIYEGKTKSGKRDGTGPFKNSAQRSTHGDKGKRKQAEVECPSKSREGKIPADKDAEQTKINKLIETVKELIGEVPGISTSDQKLLHWAIRNDTIPNKFPDDEIIFDALSHLADVMGVKALQDVESVDKADIHGYYLKYVLLPRARKTYSKQYRESKLKENEGENRLNQVVKKMLTKLTNMDDRIKSDDQAVSILTTALENELENDDFWENNVIYSIDSFFEEAGGVAESKLKEAENGYTTVAKGLEKEDADELAAEKDGMVIEDSEDKTKFSVIVKEKE